LNPDLSAEFVAVLTAMMEKDPARRIQNAAEVIERLKPWAGESVSTTLEETGQRTSSADTAGAGGPFADGAGDEAVSEASLGTDPLAASAHDTLPDAEPLTWDHRDKATWPLVLLVGAPLLLAAAMLVASLVLKAIW